MEPRNRIGQHIFPSILETCAHNVKIGLQKPQALNNHHARGFACLMQLYDRLGKEVARDLVKGIIGKYAERDKCAEDKQKKDASRDFAAQESMFPS